MPEAKEISAIAIFALTYLFICGKRFKLVPLNRTAAALVGTVLMVGTGVLTPDEAYGAVDYNTLVLLLGMMLISGYLSLAGFFDWAAEWILEVAKTPSRLLLLITVASGLLSALLVNDTVCLMLTPLVVTVIVRGRLPLMPYLLALAMSANLGSVATLVGNPQNMIIGNLSGLSFRSFSASLVPTAIAGLAIEYLILRFGFRKVLANASIEPAAVEPRSIDRTLVVWVFLVLALVFAGFCAGLNLAWTALSGGALLMVLARRDTHQVLKRVDWHLLVFFAGLFVVVAGLAKTGLPDQIFAHLHSTFGTSSSAQGWNFSWFSVIASNIFSNVPFVLVAGKWIPHFLAPDLMWKVLALSTTFAGNLTILGSVANIIVVESARGHCEVGFWDYARYGIPITILTTIVGIGLLLMTS